MAVTIPSITEVESTSGFIDGSENLDIQKSETSGKYRARASSKYAVASRNYSLSSCGFMLSTYYVALQLEYISYLFWNSNKLQNL